MEAAALNTDRELWRSGDDYYSDRVFVTEGGGIGMCAAFGRVIVKSVGEWHYLSTEVERLRAGYKAFPADVALVLRNMDDGGESVPSAADIASESSVPEKRVKEIQRALKTLGLARFGPLCDGEAEGYVARGSGYWLSRNGNDLAIGVHASGMSTFGQDPQGLEAKPASPTAATSGGDAQTPPPSERESGD